MNIQKTVDDLKNINTGYIRLWIIISIIWFCTATYFFGYIAHKEFKRSEITKCTYVDRSPRITPSSPYSYGIYFSYFNVPMDKLYSCKIKKINKSYRLDGPRHITIGRLLIILCIPLLFPTSYITYLWVKDGFDNGGK